jgi:hypothetical protein
LGDVLEVVDDRLAVVRLANAEFLAGELFRESFAQPFPVPRDDCGLNIPTPPSAWTQVVALYKWPEERFEAVGFCNWIRYRDVYLEGGMCVRKGFYRRLSAERFQALRARGGVAQIMMDVVASNLNDAAAWFGFCGDKKAYHVDIRAGFEPTDRPCLIVKWFRQLGETERRALVEMVSAIGPF